MCLEIGLSSKPHHTIANSYFKNFEKSKLYLVYQNFACRYLEDLDKFRQEYLTINTIMYTYFELNTYKKLLIFLTIVFLFTIPLDIKFLTNQHSFAQTLDFPESVTICIATSL